MMRFAGSVVLAGALLATGAQAQTAPDLQKIAKEQAKTQVPPEPVIAPLGAGTTFNATLTDTLDTHKTKAGDTITAETAEDVSYEQCLIFPKGTQIVGHVVRVTSSGKGRAGSAIFVQFDKAMMKDGQQIILNAGVQALAIGGTAPTSDNDAAAKALDAASREVPAQESATSGSATEPVVVSTIYESPRATIRTPLAKPLIAEGELNSDGLFTPDSKGAFGRPDLKVYTPTSEGSHGTVLLSAKKNLHLEGGTHLLLVVQPPPAAGEADVASAPLDLDPNQ